MKSVIPFIFLLTSCCFVQAQAQNQTASQASVSESVELKPIKTPVVPYPEEAFKNHIEGKVTLNIVIDEKGNVSKATVLSGSQGVAVCSVRVREHVAVRTTRVTTSN
jgi:TonB family protein